MRHIPTDDKLLATLQVQLTEQQRRIIKEELKEGLRRSQIARKAGITKLQLNHYIDTKAV